MLGLTVLAADARAQNGQVREYPPPQHYAAMNIFNAGNFQDAAKAFQQASLSGVRSTEGRWVDSVCYYAMIGECQYQMGALDQANASFEAALNLFLQHSNWMLRVDFPNLEPDRSALQPLINWGTTARNAVPARFTGRYQILTGRLDNSRVLSEGGVIARPPLNISNAHDNVRSNMVRIKQPGLPSITYSQDTKVHLGGKEVRAAFYGRGHTNGDSVILFPAERVIHTGDLFLKRGAPEFTPYFDFGAGGSMLEWVAVMDRIMALDFDTAIPGHGPVSPRADVEKWRADLVALRDRLRTMLKQGATKADLEKVLIADYRWPAGGLALGQLDALVAEIRQ